MARAPDGRSRVLVLGGTGFVGQALLRALAADQAHRLAWVARIDTARIETGHIERGRIERGRGVPPGIPPGLPAPILVDDLETLDLGLLEETDVVVDLVSRGRGRLATRRDIVGRIRGHARLIDEIANRRWGGHYVYMSSGGTIYGIDPPPVCVETMPVAPFSDYALEKAFVEMHLQSLEGPSGPGTALSILRVANAYGESQAARPGFGVIPAIVATLAGGPPFKLYGDGTSRRDYVHVEDIVAAILAALERPGAGVVNIGSGVGTSVRDLVGMAEAIAGRPVPLEEVEIFAAEPASVVLDAARAKERLGWSARIGIAEGLARVLAHHGLATTSRGG